MTPKVKALKRVDHYINMIPEKTHLSVPEELKFAKACAKSECEEILHTKPTVAGTADDVLQKIVQTKAYYREVINEIKKI